MIMSLGIGIFLSTLVLIIAWQIEKRSAWRTFGKIFGWSLVVVALVGAGIGGYVWWDNHKSDAALVGQRKMIANGEIAEYDGIKIGMTQDHVLYLKGKPTRLLDVESDDSDEAWMWGEFNATHTIVFWRKDGKTVDTIMCSSDGVVDCASIAGLETGDTERSVLEALGEPTTAPRYTKDGEKILIYGAPNTKWHFTFKQERLNEIYVDATATAGQLEASDPASDRPLAK
jgi:hypothetical protein